MGPRTTIISNHKDDRCIDGGYFLSSQSSVYPATRHSNKNRSYSPSYRIRGYQFSTYGDGGSCFGPKDTHFSPQKVDFERERHDEGFRPSHINRASFPLV